MKGRKSAVPKFQVLDEKRISLRRCWRQSEIVGPSFQSAFRQKHLV